MLSTAPMQFVANEVTRVVIAVPSQEFLAGRFCTPARRALGPGVLAGRVREPDSEVRGRGRARVARLVRPRSAGGGRHAGEDQEGAARARSDRRRGRHLPAVRASREVRGQAAGAAQGWRHDGRSVDHAGGRPARAAQHERGAARRGRGHRHRWQAGDRGEGGRESARTRRQQPGTRRSRTRA